MLKLGKKLETKFFINHNKLVINEINELRWSLITTNFASKKKYVYFARRCAT